VPALAAWLRRNRPDTLFATEPACNVSAILAARLARSGTRVVIREGLYPSVAKKESPYKATRIAYYLAPYVYRYADAIVAIATDMAADLVKVAKIRPDQVTTIAVNPVVTQSLLAAARAEAGHVWLKDGGSPVILGVGRLEKQKDYLTLVRAFVLVRKKRECRLLILGEGSERGALEIEIARTGCAYDIALPGFLARPFAAMAACDLFVLSSRYEGLPNVLIEAIACGAPSVSTDCPSGPADILDHGRFGPLVPVGDEAALAHAILRVLDFPPARSEMAARGAEYTVERSLDQYLPVLFPNC
jgi:glycosyltransferase involved in cell wall biosynthesis